MVLHRIVRPGRSAVAEGAGIGQSLGAPFPRGLRGTSFGFGDGDHGLYFLSAVDTFFGGGWAGSKMRCSNFSWDVFC